MVSPYTFASSRRTTKISVWGRSIFHRVTHFLRDGDAPLHEWTYEGCESSKTKLTKEGHRYYPEGEPETELTTWLFEEGTFVPMAKFVGERSYSIACDHLGTPTAAYDEAGNRVWQRELDIYGRVRLKEGETNFVPFLFQGQYYDHETKLAYNRFRYYAPELGNYVSQDPIRMAGNNPTLYGYVKDTNSWLDSFGLIPLDQMGFSVYGLLEKGATNPFYVGITNDKEIREMQHSLSGRLREGDFFERSRYF